MMQNMKLSEVWSTPQKQVWSRAWSKASSRVEYDAKHEAERGMKYSAKQSMKQSMKQIIKQSIVISTAKYKVEHDVKHVKEQQIKTWRWTRQRLSWVSNEAELSMHQSGAWSRVAYKQSIKH